jgi:multiple sugar transport system permease protein
MRPARLRQWLLRREVLAIVVSAVFLAPLVFLVLGSLRAPGETPPSGLDLIPSEPTGASFERAFELVDLGQQLLNSAIVAVIAVPLTVLVASWAGFALTLVTPRVRRVAIALSLVVLMVPLSALWVPRFVLFRQLGVIDTYVPLLAPALMGTSPLYVLLYYWSYRRVPRDLVDAARLEGLSPFAVWRRVAAPLVRPTTFAVGALAFVFHWGNFVDALLYLSSPERFTLPLGLTALRGLGPTDLPVLLAGALVATVPAVVVFALVQRQFLQGTRAAGWLGR